MTQSYQNNRWFHQLIRFTIFKLVRLFYPRIEVQGLANLPTNAPIMFVSNHPNGLLDPLLLMMGLQQPVSFLAKSTLMGNPVGKALCDAFYALPIYRKRDDGLPGGPTDDAAERNEMTFARCRELLAGGDAMALFPEGTTHSEAQLLPLRTGAARIALSAEAESNWQMGVQIVPVGLWYQSKTYFRTSVLLVVGQPFTLTHVASQYRTAERQTVQTVTEKIEAGLDKVVLQAENAELLAAVPVLASWIAPHDEPFTLTQQHRWTAKLLTAYEQLQQTDSARLDAIATTARSYADTLRTLGIDDPWALELTAPQPKKLAKVILWLIAAAPLALIGFILSYLPYRLAGPIATYAVGSYDTQTSTGKLIAGSVFVFLGWLIAAFFAGWWLGPNELGPNLGALWGLVLFAIAPPTAYLALRWGEESLKLRQLIACNWLRFRRGQLVESLVEQRHALAQQVLDALQIVTM